MIRIFIGYDPREAVAFDVLCHSIHRHASEPVTICPLRLDVLTRAGYMRRARDPLQSTDFSFSRFLVPHLCEYEGRAIFMDCDMLCLSDISEIMDTLCGNLDKAVYVVKHHHVVNPGDTKFLGEPQTPYARKNWSSVMLFNCDECVPLSWDAVNKQSGLWLHQFQWTRTERIGELPECWNQLVGVNVSRPDKGLLHYTEGGPWFDDYAQCDYAQLWYDEYRLMTGRDYR